MAITLHTDENDTIPEQDELLPGRERDAFQRDIDAMFAELKHETAAAKWPSTLTAEGKANKAKPFRRLVVGQEDATALKKTIRRAGTLHKVEPDFFKNGKTEKGHAVVKWTLSRSTDKDSKPVADDTLKDDGTPKGKIGADGKLIVKP